MGKIVNIIYREAVTNKTNILRGVGFAAINARKTECHKGHEYNKENTYIQPKGGYRICKICKKQHDLSRYN